MSSGSLALTGVIIGAVASYIATTLNERTRWKRQLVSRWDERRLESYSLFASSIDRHVVLAERIAAARGIFPYAQPIGQQDGTSAMEVFRAERSHAFEQVLLLGDAPTIAAARSVQRKVWELERIVNDPHGSADEWKVAYRTYQEHRDGYYIAARASLGIAMQFRRRSEDPPTWDLPQSS